ncbi:MAG TPA: rRNA maturation RNase YbeY [Candidatus Paceibacterota bacterium]
MKLDIKNLSRRPRPRLNFRTITEQVLGQDYELSLVFIGSTRSRRLNRVWRGKDRPANVLSFPLTPMAGEIFIDRELVKEKDLLLIFIHGLLHLKGLDHGSKMEALESQLVKHFHPHEQNDRHWS